MSARCSSLGGVIAKRSRRSAPSPLSSRSARRPPQRMPRRSPGVGSKPSSDASAAKVFDRRWPPIETTSDSIGQGQGRHVKETPARVTHHRPVAVTGLVPGSTSLKGEITTSRTSLPNSSVDPTSGASSSLVGCTRTLAQCSNLSASLFLSGVRTIQVSASTGQRNRREWSNQTWKFTSRHPPERKDFSRLRMAWIGERSVTGR